MDKKKLITHAIPLVVGNIMGRSHLNWKSRQPKENPHKDPDSPESQTKIKAAQLKRENKRLKRLTND